MTNEVVKYEQQFEEIRGIITMHRERALCSVNETVQMNKYAIVQSETAQLPTILNPTHQTRVCQMTN